MVQPSPHHPEVKGSSPAGPGSWREKRTKNVFTSLKCHLSITISKFDPLKGGLLEKNQNEICHYLVTSELAGDSSILVQYIPNHPEVKGLSPTCPGSGGEKMTKNVFTSLKCHVSITISQFDPLKGALLEQYQNEICHYLVTSELAGDSSILVQYIPNHSEVKGLSPNLPGSGGEKMAKNVFTSLKCDVSITISKFDPLKGALLEQD